MAKLRVALVFGGRSSEHEISCVTAGGVLGAIDRDKFEVVPIGITKDGIFVPAEDNTEKWALNKEQLPTVAFEGKTITWLPNREIAINGDNAGRIDVVFPVLHGPYGEDGTIQGFFELLDLPYVGNGVLASAAGMDKEFTKALFEAAGVPVTPHVVIRQHEWLRDPETALEAVKQLGGLPLFVKPARAGSSVGVSKVTNMVNFAEAVAKAFKEDDKLVVERGVVGREVEVAVLEGRNGQPTRVSVAGEIIVKGRDFYDFEAKYIDEDSVDLVIPASLTREELQEMQAIARKAFAAIGGEGLSRVDFFLTKDGFIVNEINTMPGFTRLSMFPSLWQASGIAYPELITELIELAI
jgi:D-alanine-D-alanine ligase